MAAASGAVSRKKIAILEVEGEEGRQYRSSEVQLTAKNWRQDGEASLQFDRRNDSKLTTPSRIKEPKSSDVCPTGSSNFSARQFAAGRTRVPEPPLQLPHVTTPTYQVIAASCKEVVLGLVI
jgi:hypothetical protein